MLSQVADAAASSDISLCYAEIRAGNGHFITQRGPYLYGIVIQCGNFCWQAPYGGGTWLMGITWMRGDFTIEPDTMIQSTQERTHALQWVPLAMGTSSFTEHKKHVLLGASKPTLPA